MNMCMQLGRLATTSNKLAQKLEDQQVPDDNTIGEIRWCLLRNVIQSTAIELLGRVHRQHQGWFDNNDANISSLLMEQNRLQKAYINCHTDANNAAFFNCHRRVRQRLREMQDARMDHKPDKSQGYAGHNEMENILKAIKASYGPCIKGTTPQLRSDGTTFLTEKSQIRKRWLEHFRSFRYFSSAISDDAIDRLPHEDTNSDRISSFPTSNHLGHATEFQRESTGTQCQCGSPLDAAP
ncbi:unnamed protein product [Schistocephalus solidus]|uniref:Uncharacterized protein n=1 Tax=Schistocephalus solidus TaxID=70667 RepID=A0A183SAV9_SCHSO|nr:unnamed protein product [Schistocephalus solidus]